MVFSQNNSKRHSFHSPFELMLETIHVKTLTKERNYGTTERVILKDPEFENNKTPRTRESLNDGGKRKRSTINPAGTFEKYDWRSSRPSRNSKMNPRQLFTSDVEIDSLNAAKNIFRRSNSTPKRRGKPTRKERQEKSSRLRNFKDCLETSSDSSTSIKNSRSILVSNPTMPQRTSTSCGNDYLKITNILNENVKEGSFHLRSPKLFLNHNEPSNSSRTTDSPVAVATGNGFEIESSETISSDDVSFSVQRVRFEDNAYYQQISDLLRNNSPSTYGDQIYDQPRMLRDKNFSWILPHNNISESDATTFSDDGMSSFGYSPMNCNESTLAMIDSNSTSDGDIQKVFPLKSRIFIHGDGGDTDNEQPSFSQNSLMKKTYRCISPNNKRSLPLKKRQVQWDSLLDPLESALTTSMEKLNEIKGDL